MCKQKRMRINCKKLASVQLKFIQEKIEKYVAKGFRPPALGMFMAGDRKDSKIYVGNKRKACDKVGISVKVKLLEDDTKSSLDQIAMWNDCKEIDGILVQLPMVNGDVYLEKIRWDKDVDGLHPYNIGKCSIGQNAFIPPTAQAVVQVCKSHYANLAGKHAVVVGRSRLVGMPVRQLLLQHDCTVVQCHSKSINIKDQIRQADIVVAACGVPEMIRGEWLKPKSLVVDVGLNLDRDTKKLVGDVNHMEAIPVVDAITPVPGGIGRLTVAMLLKNVFKSYEERIGQKI